MDIRFVEEKNGNFPTISNEILLEQQIIIMNYGSERLSKAIATAQSKNSQAKYEKVLLREPCGKEEIVFLKIK